MIKLSTQKITLGAYNTVDGNGTPLDQDIYEWPGVMLISKEADYPFQVSFDDGEWNDFDLAMKANCPPGLSFKRVKVRNLGPAPSELAFLVGNMNITDGRLAVSENRNGSAASFTPPALTELEVTEGLFDVVVDEWVELVPYDANREEIWLSTDSATAAYWGLSATDDISPARNLVPVGGEGRWTKLKTKAAIYVRHTEAAKTITALVFSF